VVRLQTNNHVREDDLTSLCREMQPAQLLMVHGMSSRLIRYARRMGEWASAPRIGEEIDLDPPLPRVARSAT
jgi:mRNA degradation ribonuclease J1/J2